MQPPSTIEKKVMSPITFPNEEEKKDEKYLEFVL
jgi:hypothetical protein